MLSALVTLRVWDLPTRLFHWALASLVAICLVTVHLGGEAMTWHLRSGCAILSLLAFRVVWGLFGGHWSRFAQFIYSPATLLRYVRGRPQAGMHLDVGHSPTGALAVFAMFAILAVQVGTGLVADDDIATAGPLVRFVSGSFSRLSTSWHTTWGQWLLLGMIAAHLGAITYYVAWKRRQLIAPMIHGDKQLPVDVRPSVDHPLSRLLALVLLSLCAAAGAAIASLGM